MNLMIIPKYSRYERAVRKYLPSEESKKASSNAWKCFKLSVLSLIMEQEGKKKSLTYFIVSTL